MAMANRPEEKAAKAEREEAIGFFRAALSLRPDSAGIHLCLGQTLYEIGNRAESEEECRRVIQLDPKNTDAPYDLGVMLTQQKKLSDAEDEFRKSIALDTGDPRKDPSGYYNLACVLDFQGPKKWPEAEKVYRQTLAFDPRYSSARINLIRLLKKQSRFAEAGDVAQKWMDALPPDDMNRKRALQEVGKCRRLSAIDPQKLPAVLKGVYQPVGNELITFAELCACEERYGDACRLYLKAFRTDAKLAEDREYGDRYAAAAAAAARRAAGDGKGAAPDEAERKRWRRQAYDWLREDLNDWAAVLDHGPASARAEARMVLEDWRDDDDLDSVHDHLDKLPENERQAWQKLWADVDALLQRAQTAPKP